MGQAAYPKATRLLITADAGDSNGSRLRLWKVALQELADQTGVAGRCRPLSARHRKWNKIEHRLFSYINWSGKPLRGFETIVSLIAATNYYRPQGPCGAQYRDLPWATGIMKSSRELHLMARLFLDKSRGIGIKRADATNTQYECQSGYQNGSGQASFIIRLRLQQPPHPLPEARKRRSLLKREQSASSSGGWNNAPPLFPLCRTEWLKRRSEPDGEHRIPCHASSRRHYG